MMNSTTRLTAIFRQLKKWASVKRLNVIDRFSDRKPLAAFGDDNPPLITHIWLDYGYRFSEHFPDKDLNGLWKEWTGHEMQKGAYVVVCKGTLFRYEHPPRTFEELLNSGGVADAS